MSPPITSVTSGGQQAPTSSGPYSSNNNNNNNDSNNNNSSGSSERNTNSSAAAGSSNKHGRAPLSRKRSSVASNLSSLGANGSGHGSLHSCTSSGGSTHTSADDLDSGERSAPAHYTNAEYEHIRNTTLLFFLDRLYLASQEGKEARTLHDLACLFGTKEFTKDMRQIVGASRNGLKRFLQSYPSLFQIEGDKVHLTQLKGNSMGAPQRDYNSEAAEYFKLKLMQFGTSLVPIKNLFGYRSQAPQEVRHVSGKNTRDFKRFLKQNEHVFEILADEHVMLKSTLRELESQGQTSSALEQSLQPLEPDEAIVSDPYLNKQFAHLVEDCIKKMRLEHQQQQQQHQAGKENDSGSADQDGEFKVTLEYLHERIQQQHSQNELFPKIVKTIDDLKVFLRMHPSLFKRFSAPAAQTCDAHDDNDGEKSETKTIEYVSLLSEADRKQNEIRANFARQSSTLMAAHHDQSATTSSSNTSTNNDISTTTTTASANATTTNSTTIAPTSATTTSKPNFGKENWRHELGAADRAEPRSLPIGINDRDHQAGATGNKFPTGNAAAKQNNNNSNKPSPASHQQLRANAPPFVPSKPKSHQPPGPPLVASNNNYHPDRQAPMQRSLSNLAPGYRGAPSSSAHRGAPQHVGTAVGARPGPQQAPPAVDQRQAIRSYLLKGSQTGGQHHNMNWARHEQAEHQQHQQQQQHSAPKPVAMPAGGDMRARTVDIVREASNIITRIMATTDAVAFDCKGYNLGFDGQITLIQFGYLPAPEPASSDPMLRSQLSALGKYQNKRAPGSGPLESSEKESDVSTKDKTSSGGYVKPEVCVFDLITNPELAYCLKPLLESDKIVKIVHDVRNKSNALHVQFDITLKNVFDTQVANLVIQQQDTGKPAYKSRYISMSKLCEIYGNEELIKYRNLIKFKTRHSNGSTSAMSSSGSLSRSSSKDVNYWRTRPLTKPMIFEATMDVYCLVGTIYQNLKSKIKPEYEPLFDQLNLEGVFARIKPDEIRSVKKERKIDLEVIDLKRKLYSDTLGPVVLSNREIRLLRHIDLTPEVRQKIQQCKKVAKKLERLDMKAAQLREQLEGPQSMGSSASQLSSINNETNNNNNSGLGAGAGAGGNDASIRCEEGSADLASGLMERRDRAAGQAATFADKMDAFNATGMMMDSSVLFEELKDKMIESSSLLESLEDDDDDVGSASGSGGGGIGRCGSSSFLSSSAGHQHSQDSCKCQCQCHRSSSDSGSSADSSLKHNQQQQLSRALEEDKVKQLEKTLGSEPSSQPTTAPASGNQKSEEASPALDSIPLKEPKVSTTTATTPTVETKSALGPESSDVAATDSSEPAKATGDKTGEQAVDIIPNEKKQQQQQTKGDESEQDDSKSSLACDMAVQCDLMNEL